MLDRNSRSDAQIASSACATQRGHAQVLARKAEAGSATTTYDRWRTAHGVVSDQEREQKHAGFDARSLD